MTSHERAELVSRYRGGARALLDTLAGIPDADLDRTAADGGWSPRTVAHHVADSELTAAARLRRLIAEDGPRIPPYDQDVYAGRLHYERPLATSLALISALTESNAELLDRLSDEEWVREGVHEERGPYSVETWLTVYADHCRAHSVQVAGTVN
jgi:DinB family protein